MVLLEKSAPRLGVQPAPRYSRALQSPPGCTPCAGHSSLAPALQHQRELAVKLGQGQAEQELPETFQLGAEQ